MSLRLTGAMRAVAARLSVLVYLCCVVSPSFALAAGIGSTPCFEAAAAAAPAMHAHVAHADLSAHHHDDVAMHHHADAPAQGGDHHGKMAGPCCAVLCVVGIARDLPELAAPLRWLTAHPIAGQTALAGRMPPLLDRPPIVLV